MIYTLTLNPAVDRELTVPALAYNSVLRASAARVDFGGKGFNVSRLLAGLGEPTTAVAFLGGRAGDLLREGLAALGIGVEWVAVDGETRTNTSIVEAGGGRYLKVNEPGPVISPGQGEALLGRVRSLARPGDGWVLAGSLPPGLPDDFYARIITLLAGYGAWAVLDTTGEPLRLGCAARPLLVKPNADEAEALTGLPARTVSEAAAAARAIRGLGAANVVLSMGKTGAVLAAEAGAWFARSPQVVEQNPTGAGDSMVAGMVWALAAGRALPEALGWGVAAGAATASLPGTAVGSRPLIEALAAQVRPEPV